MNWRLMLLLSDHRARLLNITKLTIHECDIV